MQRIYLSERDGKQCIFFETGLDPRSFARTKLSQCFTEPGFIVFPDGSIKEWKAAGVFEQNGFMMVWGPKFNGKRLDLLINDATEEKSKSKEDLQTAFQAITFWIRAKLLMGDRHSALNPGAAFVSCQDDDATFPKGTVFFAPENLSQRSLLAEAAGLNRYVCPDLSGIDAAAFCAAAMLYKILAKVYPYRDAEIYEDMRDGVFIPPHLSAPGLDKNLSSLIESALLLPVENKKPSESAADILGSLLKILISKDNKITGVSSLFKPISDEEKVKLENEKSRYSMRTNITVSAKRFVVRNKIVLWGIAAALIFAGFVTITMVRSQARQPTTAGMNPSEVIKTYYEAFSSLDHTLMEACVMGADKSDIDIAARFFVVTRVRQSTEGTSSSMIPADVWKKSGGDFPAPNVFGVTDLIIERRSGNEAGGQALYRADYTLWYPNELPAHYRSDDLTLKLDKRGNWRITEILRAVKYSSQSPFEPESD